MTNDAPLLLDVSRLIWRRWKGRHPTGIDRVCLAYLDHFAPRSQAVVQHSGFRRIINRRASQQMFSMLRAPDRLATRLATVLAQNLRGSNRRAEQRIYLNVGHTGLDSPGFVHWVGRSGARPVFLIHDLIPISHPQFCRPGEELRHRKRMRAALTTATGIIANSQATLDELAAFAAKQDLPMPPAVVAWLGSDPMKAPSAVAPPDRPTFVTLGTIEGRKNHALLLDVWLRLIEEYGDRSPRLLIIGQRGWEADPIFDRLDQDERLRGHVVELGNCSDAEIGAHLASARALLFPSLAEGYGLPLVEALGAGVPVIASDLPVFREIGGNIPTLLDPRDASGWHRAVMDYANPDSNERGEQLERMRDFRPPDWPAHFATVERWLQTLG